MSDQRYLDIFNDTIKTLNSYDIVIDVSKLIIEQEYGDISMKTADEKDELKKEAQEKFLAYSYLKGMCRERYGTIKEELHNEFLNGQKNYPKTVQEAYELQTEYWKKAAKK